MTTQTPTPLPCPFCGSLRSDIGTSDMEVFWVECCGCDAEGPPARLEADAITAWNRAPRPPSAVDLTRQRSHRVRDRKRLRLRGGR